MAGIVGVLLAVGLFELVLGVAQRRPQVVDPPPAQVVPAAPASAPVSPPPGPPPPPREPTDAEAAEFAAAFRPEGAMPARASAQDANGDGRREIVLASLVGGVARVDVAAWDGQAYTVVATGTGPLADEVVDLQVREATGDGSREILLVSRGAAGTSVALFGWDGTSYVPQIATGGCADGRHTFGVAGADVGVGRLTATCDAAQPPQLDTYRWDRSSRFWVYDPGT